LNLIQGSPYAQKQGNDRLLRKNILCAWTVFRPKRTWVGSEKHTQQRR